MEVVENAWLLTCCCSISGGIWWCCIGWPYGPKCMLLASLCAGGIPTGPAAALFPFGPDGLPFCDSFIFDTFFVGSKLLPFCGKLLPVTSFIYVFSLVGIWFKLSFCCCAILFRQQQTLRTTHGKPFYSVLLIYFEPYNLSLIVHKHIRSRISYIKHIYRVK